MVLNVIRANPAGNITLLVLDRVQKEHRAKLSAELIGKGELDAEQVGFIVPPTMGGQGRLEMMGGEFCGNAARSFGLYLAKNIKANDKVLIEVSGNQNIMEISVDRDYTGAFAAMPLPVNISRCELLGKNITLVEFEGITHAICRVPPTGTFAHDLLREIDGDYPAFGVMFLAEDNGKTVITPWVRVAATSTEFWESSCASGTVATAISLSEGVEGVFACEIHQAGGVIAAEITRNKGGITSARIGGPVEIGEPVTIEGYEY